MNYKNKGTSWGLLPLSLYIRLSFSWIIKIRLSLTLRTCQLISQNSRGQQLLGKQSQISWLWLLSAGVTKSMCVCCVVLPAVIATFTPPSTPNISCHNISNIYKVVLISVFCCQQFHTWHWLCFIIACNNTQLYVTVVMISRIVSLTWNRSVFSCLKPFRSHLQDLGNNKNDYSK